MRIPQPVHQYVTHINAEISRGVDPQVLEDLGHPPELLDGTTGVISHAEAFVQAEVIDSGNIGASTVVASAVKKRRSGVRTGASRETPFTDIGSDFPDMQTPSDPSWRMTPEQHAVNTAHSIAIRSTLLADVYAKKRKQ